MKKVPVVAGFVIFYAIFFQVAVSVNMDLRIIFPLFFLSPFLIIYMGYIILKYGKPSDNTFNERFYDDWDYERNGKEEPAAEG